jgi:hypothetical protein
MKIVQVADLDVMNDCERGQQLEGSENMQICKSWREYLDVL